MKQVKGYIERKTMLYVTGVEYGDYTMNHVLGCSHGCKYPCYAFLMKKRFAQVADYESWLQPYLVANTLELLDSEIPKLKHKIKSVQLCFTTDPFMYQYDEIKQMSLAAIKRLNKAGIKCTVLTKGILPIELAHLSQKNEYGITLITLNDLFRRRIEPGAASIKMRIKALRSLHDRGCFTWVSMEPYPTPNQIDQNLHTILNEISFVNKIIFGRMNYCKEVSLFQDYAKFYNKKAQQVIAFCEKHGIAYHIKDGTITHPDY